MADSSNNVVTLVGTLGADPEVRRTPTGKDVVSFSLVTNERIRAADGTWTDGAASWFRVTAWNTLGVHAAMSFKKGQRVIARGTLKIDTWQMRDGGTSKTVELTAQALGHDLLWGTSTFTRSSTSTRPEREVDAPAPDPWEQQERAVRADPPAPAAAQALAPTVVQAAQPQWSTLLKDDDVPF